MQLEVVVQSMAAQLEYNPMHSGGRVAGWNALQMIKTSITQCYRQLYI